MMAGGRAAEVDAAAPDVGETVAVEVGDVRVLVCNVEGELFAIENQCTHARIELTAGQLIGAELECPVHGARFDVRTGEVTCRPARRAIRTFAVERIEGGMRISTS